MTKPITTNKVKDHCICVCIVVHPN